MRKLSKLTIAFLLFSAFFTFPINVFAQSLYLNPKGGNVGLQKEITFEIHIKQPTINMNAVAIRLDIPEDFTIMNLSKVNDDRYAYFDPCDTTESFYKDNQICFDVSKLGGIYFQEGEVLGTFTLNSVEVGTGTLQFVDGTELVDAETLTSYFVTGTGATLTVSESATEFTPINNAAGDDSGITVQEKVNTTISSTSEDNNDGKLEIGGTAIDGRLIIVLGVVILLAVLCGLLYVLLKRKRGTYDLETSAEPDKSAVSEPLSRKSASTDADDEDMSGPRPPGASPLA